MGAAGLNIFECKYVLRLFVFLRFLKAGYLIKGFLFLWEFSALTPPRPPAIYPPAPWPLVSW